MFRILTIFFLIFLSAQNAFSSDRIEYIDPHFLDSFLESCESYYEKNKKNNHRVGYYYLNHFKSEVQQLRSLLKNQSQHSEKNIMVDILDSLFRIVNYADPEFKFQTAQFIQGWELTYLADLKFSIHSFDYINQFSYYNRSILLLAEAANQGHKGAQEALKTASVITDVSTLDNPYYHFFASRLLKAIGDYSNLSPADQKCREKDFQDQLNTLLNPIVDIRNPGYLSYNLASFLIDQAQEKDMMPLYDPALRLLKSLIYDKNGKFSSFDDEDASILYAKTIIEREYFLKNPDDKNNKERGPSSVQDWYNRFIKDQSNTYSKATASDFIYLIKNAAKQDDFEATLLLSYLYNEGVRFNTIAIHPDKKKSLELLSDLTFFSSREKNKHFAEAAEQLGILYYEKYLEDQYKKECDLDSAAKWVKKANDLGSERAFSYLYVIYKTLSDLSIRTAEQYSNMDNNILQLYIKRYHYYLEKAEKYQRKADKYLERYSEFVLRGKAQNINKLFDGDFNRLGRDLRNLGSYDLARRCFEKLEGDLSQKQRSLEANFLLADMDKCGEGLLQNDYESAFARYQKVFKQHKPRFIKRINLFDDNIISWPNALVHIARMQAQGLGTQQSYLEAAKTMDTLFNELGLRCHHVSFYEMTVNKMNEGVEDKFYSRFKGFRYVSLANFLNLQGNKITIGQFRELLPQHEALEQLFKDYVNRLKTKVSTTQQASPLEQSSSDYLHAILPLKGGEDSEVPMDTLRFYGILNNFQKRDAEDGFDIFENQFCPSIINCTTGKSDSLVRYFNSSLSGEEKYRYVTRLNRDQKDFEIIIDDYLVSTLSIIIEETFSDDKEFLPFFIPSMIEGEYVEQPSHQTAFIRSCLGHHLGLTKEYVYDEVPSCVDWSLNQMTPTNMLTKFFEYMTPQKFIEKFKGKIDGLLNDEAMAETYLKPFTEYLEDGQNENHRPNFSVTEKDDKEFYVIEPHAVEKALLKGGLLRDARGEGEELF